MAQENTVIFMHSTLTQDAAATIDVPDDGLLLASKLHISGVLNADAESIQASLEFGSVSADDTNDARQVLNFVMGKMGLLTSGAAANAFESRLEYGDGIKVFGGERLYLHTSAAGGTLTNARCLLVFRFATFAARRR